MQSAEHAGAARYVASGITSSQLAARGRPNRRERRRVTGACRGRREARLGSPQQAQMALATIASRSGEAGRGACAADGGWA